MAISDAYFTTITLKSVVYSDHNDLTPTVIASGIPARLEHTEKLVRDKLGHDITSNYLFFFDPNNITQILPDYIITHNSVDYFIVRADLLYDRTSPHHWECYCV